VKKVKIHFRIKIYFSIVFIIPFAILLVMSRDRMIKMFLLSVWVIISFFILEPLLLQYK